ncbi:hypothetical protein F5Y00DRAFT_261775 [Daldinia vernicosa]|uniref:uncharacterized protein n=1 Tax=Daldinia vernicosa TaxID=114800 RepID=UPI00200723DC|nr:uncharacterized protein F5Y00DRAFT_261775 [Daldinia vernicosa]KAI0849306.1 hypothetical protein F5Y00DRAFT_261775 [Daldinia vernicosa]
MNALATNQLGSTTLQRQGTRPRRMKGKRKISPNSTQGWTPPSSNSQNSDNLSNDCRLGLVSIVQAVHNANVQYKSIVDEYLRWRNKLRTRSSSNPNSTRFSNDDLQTLDEVMKAYLSLDQSIAWQLLANLGDKSYIDIWKRAADNMAYLKGLWKHQAPKHLEKARNRAVDLKNCRVTVESSFKLVEKELRDSGFDHYCEAILAKKDMLLKYEEAYPILPEPRPASEIRQESPLTFQMSTLIFIVFTAVALSFIPMGMAWSRSTNTPGSTQDPDFYLQIQNMMLQLLGLSTAMLVAHQRLSDNKTAWNYACYFTVAGVICTILAVPVYAFVSTIWSSFASYLATVMQVGATLQLALIAKTPKQKQL